MVVYNEEHFTVRAFTGMDQNEITENAPDSAIDTATNLLLQSDGSLRKRPGVTLFNSKSPGGGGVFPTIQFYGQLILLSGLSGSIYDIFIDSSSVGQAYYTTTVGTTPTVIPGIPSGTIFWSGCQYNDFYYFACESGVYKWSGSGSATLVTGSPPSIRQLIALRDRLWGIVADNLHYTDAADDTVWNVILINPNDGTDCTNIVPFGDRLLIFKSESMWALYFADDPLYWYIRCQDPSLGCIGPLASELIEGYLYFVSRQGFHKYDGVTHQTLWKYRYQQAIPPQMRIDIFSASVSRYQDWVLAQHPTVGGFMCYKFGENAGFTKINFASLVINSKMREAKRFQDGGNAHYVLTLGQQVYMFDDASTENVDAWVETKGYDLGQMVRSKRIKWGSILVTGTFSEVQMQWVMDGWARETPEIFIEPLLNEAGFGYPRNIRVSGCEFTRVVAMYIEVHSSHTFTLYGFTMVSQLHRNQTMLGQGTTTND